MKFDVQVEVNECYTTVSCDPIPGQGQGHKTFKVRNSSIFKVSVLRCLQCGLANDWWFL